ncbi:MAG: hypothetical protein HC831_04200 [Chloroflexia bacterium]|nr:hypothetical protein [Chloroflexia bacterium]
MKNIYLVFAFIGLFMSYSKNAKTQVQTEIIGRWTWVETSGGFAGGITTPETTGNQITIEFTRVVI